MSYTLGHFCVKRFLLSNFVYTLSVLSRSLRTSRTWARACMRRSTSPTSSTTTPSPQASPPYDGAAFQSLCGRWLPRCVARRRFITQLSSEPCNRNAFLISTGLACGGIGVLLLLFFSPHIALVGPARSAALHGRGRKESLGPYEWSLILRNSRCAPIEQYLYFGIRGF